MAAKPSSGEAPPDDARRRGAAGDPPEGGFDRGLAPRSETAAAFGRQVALHREAAGLSQAGLAALAELSQAGLSHIEAGTRTPSIETARLIARALGVSVGVLMGEPRAALGDAEALFLAQWRAAPATVRATVSRFLRFCIADQAGRRPPRRR